jgi:peptidylprolyl isomerase
MSTLRSLRILLLLAPALAACDATFDAPLVAQSEAALSPRADLAVIREIEDHRLLGNKRLQGYLHSPHVRVAAAAAIAAGRIADPSLATDVTALLDAPAAEVRAAAALGLQLIAPAGAEASLATRFAVEPELAVQRALLLAIGHVGSAASVPLVSAQLTAAQPEELQTAAAEAYATLVRAGVDPGATVGAVGAQLLAFAGSQPEARAVAAAFALAQVAGKAALKEADVVTAFRRSPAPSARAYLARSLAALNTATATQVLADASAADPDARVRADSCRFAAKAGATPPVLAALSAALGDPAAQVAVAAATAIATFGADAASLQPALVASYDKSPSAWVRSTVLTALVAVGPASARSRVEAGLKAEWPVKLAAIPALAVLGTDADVATLIALAGDPDVRFSSAAIEALASLAPSRATPAMKTALTAALATRDVGVVSSVVDAAVAFGWKDLAPQLSALYDAFPGPANLNGRLAILYGLGNLGSTADLPLIQRGLADDEKLVSQTAADAWQQLTGKSAQSQVRAESVVHDKTPSPAEIDAALASLVLLETGRGPIVLRMLPEAPLSAANFVALAAGGFYDGLCFHRVVPNFVAQGGDPRGDGSGGSDQLVREEISLLQHRRGTVGMATEGKDTGSSQIFINDGWNVSLDGNYTVFGEVVLGMDAADRLEVGDLIDRAVVLSGATPLF